MYSHNSWCDFSKYILRCMSKTQHKFQNRTLFVLIFLAKEDSICSNKSFFRQCVVLLFGKVSGATDGHCARGSGNSLRRRQVHNCNRQLQLGWVGPGNLYLCRHSEGGWKLHTDWLSTHKLTGHVSVSIVCLEVFSLICRVEAVPQRSPLLVLQFPEGKSLLTVDWVGVLARFVSVLTF